MTWGLLATTDGANPRWESENLTCYDSYCHGVTLSGGANKTPIWTEVDGTQAACGTCHGDPPPAPHVQDPDCSLCHPGTISPEGLIDVEGGLHINGVVDVVDLNGCSSCHGSEDNPAPPVSTLGETSTEVVTVGAHQSHLNDSSIRQAVECSECHVVPSSYLDPGHVDAAPAEVTWGTLATAEGASPTWDRGAATCAGSYCHGATLSGGRLTTPDWVKVDGSQSACGTCHGAPPPAPHPNDTDCAACHPDTVQPDGSIDVEGGFHINGQLDIGGMACSSCHGNDTNAAPPVSVEGDSSTSVVTVGAHQSHLTDSYLRKAVACDECHVVPEGIDDEGHMDTSPAEVTWGLLASAGGVSPDWDRDKATCSDSYCHGATLGGGTKKSPTWTVVNGSQATCGTCHGLPPPSPHPAMADCAMCHPDTITPEGDIDVEGEKHINGVIDVVDSDCGSCHGSDENPAPPVSISGASSTSEVTVGAHQSHLHDSYLRKAIDCSECHTVPTGLEDAGHIDDAPAELTFGELATVGNVSPSWDRTAATCSDTYCHGATLSGGYKKKPLWTKVDGSQSTCGTCHGTPPPSPHPASADCWACHPATVLQSGEIDVEGGMHINGTLEVMQTASCSSCHGNVQNAAPPVSTRGATSPLEIEVGAHQSHLLDSDIRLAIDCEECHVVPTSTETPGHIDSSPAELTFGELATTSGTTPIWDRETATCADSYCHGATLEGGADVSPLWTRVDGTQAECGSCHGAPPPAPHPQQTACANCHPATVLSSGEIDIQGGKHINGVVEAAETACNSCHGSADNPAPPLSTQGISSTADVTVGAHQAHLSDGDVSRAMACDECHVVPAGEDDPGHIDDSPAEVTWGALSQTDGATPSWNRTQATCQNTYCHGTTLEGGTKTTPVWTVTDGTQTACGTCHGNPPPSPHPQNSNCATCHPGTVEADGSLNVSGGKHVNGILEVSSMACNSCHGSSTNAAPPVATSGASSTSDVAVGAHQSHLLDSDIRAAINCEECHVVPETNEAPGHIDTAPAEVTWGDLATAQGSQPDWNHTSMTCTDSYCHGATLTGGDNTSPVWTVVDGTQAACGTCHGAPPPAPHPSSSDCSTCHPETVDVGGNINVVGGKHINGTLEVVGGSCSSCHGSSVNAAPPVSTTGSSSVSDVAVGAHQAHMVDGDLRTAVPCEECHKVPSSSSDPGHIDASPAEVSWGSLARADGSNPAWNRTSATCADTYCHGSSLTGGTLTDPLWTKMDGTQTACGTCHGAPPPPPHTQSNDCYVCHPATVNAAGQVDVKGGKHINGMLEVVDAACNACHGSSVNEAPPVATTGASSTADIRVGAHQSHLLEGAISAAMACEECHVVPSSAEDPGHIDASPAELTWGDLATTDGALPAWNRSQATCTDSYCHGATLSGGSNTAPIWTVVDGTQSECGTCHGDPPPAPHPQNPDCHSCHADTVLASGLIDVEGGAHVDGIIEATDMSCNSCHGSSINDAPPVDTTGGSSTSLITVGAHQSHMTSGDVRAAVPCSECHVVPSTWDASGHIDASPAEVTFGTLSKTDGAAPSWNRTNARCSNDYCHGSTLSGGTNKAPTWTLVNGSQSACGTCHGNPPPAPHVSSTNCYACHPNTVTSSNQINIAAGKHINGVLDVVAAECNACHGNATNDAPPVATTGASSTSDIRVGAHQSHLLEGAISIAMECDECHAVPVTAEDAGHIDASPAELEWGTLATTDGATPSWDRSKATCTNSYCHGSTLSGGTLKTPVWTTVNGTQAACGTCHGNPPPSPHVQDSDCGLCHPETMTASNEIDVLGGAHIDGIVEAVDMTCNSCHGNSTNAAPPVDTNGASSTTTVTVGAHQSHLMTGDVRQAIPCTECHVVPSSWDASGHIDASPAEVVFGTLAKTDGLNPSWNRTSARCTNAYCHGSSLSGGTNKLPTWTVVDGSQSACGTCHGNPPPAPHANSTNCYVCHPQTMTSSNQLNISGGKHINGTLEAQNAACNACHGSTTNNAPPLATTGASATSDIRVGAHQPHLLASSKISSPIACTECHIVPATNEASGHLDASPAEVTFGTLAKTGNLSPTWNRSTVRCSTTYCHGGNLRGGTNTQPYWTTVNNTQDACGTCHGRPPSTGQHGDHNGYNCNECHNTVATSSSITNPALHINGTKEVSLRQGGTWNSSTKTCDPACHGSEYWY